MSLNIRPVFEILNGTTAAATTAAPPAGGAVAADASGGGGVTFPEDYPNSVKHFLLIGALGMLIGAGIFLYLGMIRSKASIAHSVTFIIPAVGAMSYYAMWTGLGVEFKTTDDTPRVIFWARYVDYVITIPLLLINLCLISKAETSAMVSGVGNAILFVISLLVGAMNIAPFKYMWWFAGVVFVALLLVQLVGRFEGANDIHKALNIVVIVVLCAFPLVWLIGSEGTASLGLSQEVAFMTVLDLVAKVGFGLYFLLNFEAAMGDEVGEDGMPLNQQSQQYV